MAKNAGLEGRKTNHSGRHTAVNMLSKSGLADSTIAKHTGHKNVEGLKPYKSLDLDTQKNISRILMEKASHAPSTSNTTMDQQATCSINSSVNYTLGSQWGPSTAPYPDRCRASKCGLSKPEVTVYLRLYNVTRRVPSHKNNTSSVH